MKLTSIELQPGNSSEICVLSFRDPRRENSYNVKGVTGLDAEDILPRFYGSSGSEKYYDLMVQKREITVLIELNPNYSINETPSDLRDTLYKFIASSRTGLIDIRFKNGTTVLAGLSGFITKFESSLFTKTPEIQLTIKCKEPMLKAPARTSLDVSSLDPALTIIQDNLSTAPHGLIFTMNVLSPISGFTITDPDSDWSFVVGPSGGFSGFLAGDVIYFSSEFNNKYVYFVRGAVTTHFADAISVGSYWPIIFPGQNKLSFTNPTALDWTSIQHYPTYWGN